MKLATSTFNEPYLDTTLLAGALPWHFFVRPRYTIQAESDPVSSDTKFDKPAAVQAAGAHDTATQPAFANSAHRTTSTGASKTAAAESAAEEAKNAAAAAALKAAAKSAKMQRQKAKKQEEQQQHLQSPQLESPHSQPPQQTASHDNLLQNIALSHSDTPDSDTARETQDQSLSLSTPAAMDTEAQLQATSCTVINCTEACGQRTNCITFAEDLPQTELTNALSRSLYRHAFNGSSEQFCPPDLPCRKWEQTFGTASSCASAEQSSWQVKDSNPKLQHTPSFLCCPITQV